MKRKFRESEDPWESHLKQEKENLEKMVNPFGRRFKSDYESERYQKYEKQFKKTFFSNNPHSDREPKVNHPGPLKHWFWVICSNWFVYKMAPKILPIFVATVFCYIVVFGDNDPVGEPYKTVSHSTPPDGVTPTTTPPSAPSGYQRVGRPSGNLDDLK